VTAAGTSSSPSRRSAPPRRIVSLVPSLTETLFALGAGTAVVGVTRFCEEPARALAGVTRVGGTKNPDVRAIRALQPDLVVASSEENRREDVEALIGAGLDVLVTHFPTVADALSGVALLARRIGGEVRVDAQPWWRDAARLVAAPRRARPVRYFCPIWRNPYMVARSDTYLADLLRVAGGESVFADSGSLHYATADLDELSGLQPDVVLLPDEPYRFAPRHLADLNGRGIAAVERGQVFFVDGKALTWYGPRTAVAIERFDRIFRAAAAAAARDGAGQARDERA
jgi:ABC-type Fe3+-hydroxamate transport system substrate-binding protein